MTTRTIIFNTATTQSTNLKNIMFINDLSFEEVLKKAIECNALMIVRVSNGNYYMKGEYSDEKFYEWNYKLGLLEEVGERASSKTYLIRRT